MAVQVAIALATYRTAPSTHSTRSSAASDASCAKPTDGISPGAVEVDAGGGGGGAVTPTVGTSPAKTEAERTQVTTSVIIKRFIQVSPFEDARLLTSERIEQLPEVLASS